MIKARAGDLLIIGLSEENVKRLKERKPIYADLKALGIGGKIAIYYGETETKLADELKELIGPNTVVQDNRN